MKKRILIVIITLQVLVFTLHSYSQIIHVPADQPTIQNGINAASNSDTILVDTGTYIENINYLGKNIILASNYLLTGDTSFINNTVIRCLDSTISTVSIITNEDSTTLLCGFTISLVNDPWVFGIECENSSPRLNNLKIIDSSETGWAAGIMSDSSNLYLDDVMIQTGCYAITINKSTITIDNSPVIDGGTRGISCSNSILNISNSAIMHSKLGIYCSNSSLSVENSEISNNRPWGGMQSDNCSLNIENSIVSNNLGGGLKCSNSDLDVVNTCITANSPGWLRLSGAGISSSGSNVFLQNVTITENISRSPGGGIRSVNDSSFVFDSIHRCNIYGNFGAYEGNDIYCDTLMTVVVDTFSVLDPTNFQAAHIENFTFDILYGLHTPVNADLYVSPEGNNMNSGLSPDEPMKNIWFTIPLMITDSLNPRMLHLLPGTYSYSSNEWFPVKPGDYMNLEGTSREEVILSSVDTKFEIKNSTSNELSNFTIEGEEYGIYCENSNPVISNILNTTSRGIKCISSNPEFSDMLISYSSTHKYGIELDSSSAIMNNIEITYNYGLGMYCSYSNPVISNSVISNNDGGGIYLYHSDAVLSDVDIYDNTFHGGVNPDSRNGAGLCCEHSNPVLNNVMISRNEASTYNNEARGGGLYCYCSKPILNNVEITENLCRGNNVGAGGGIYLSSSQPEFNEVLVSGNICENNGGGIACDTNCIIRNVMIIGNEAKYGAGIHIEGNSIIEDVLIRDNTASSWGGGISIGGININIADNSPVLERVEIVSNSAPYRGGGIMIYEASPIIKNSLIADNTVNGTWPYSNHGAGIGVYEESSPTLTNLTITNNTCDLGGGGIFTSDDSHSQLTNSIVWNNEPDALNGSDTCFQVIYSDIQGGWIGDGNIDTNPLFFGSTEHPYQVTQNSPCVDAGTPDTTGINIGLYDLMGNFRLWNGDLDEDTIVDMGSYEYGSVGAGIEGSSVDSKQSAIIIYPNPSSNIFSVDIQPGIEVNTIEIINIQGKVVLHQKVTNENLTFNISRIPNGLYFVRVYTINGIEVKKLIIQ